MSDGKRLRRLRTIEQRSRIAFGVTFPIDDQG